MLPQDKETYRTHPLQYSPPIPSQPTVKTPRPSHIPKPHPQLKTLSQPKQCIPFLNYPPCFLTTISPSLYIPPSLDPLLTLYPPHQLRNCYITFPPSTALSLVHVVHGHLSFPQELGHTSYPMHYTGEDWHQEPMLNIK